MSALLISTPSTTCDFIASRVADAAARFVALPLPRLEQFPNLAELTIYQQIEADRGGWVLIGTDAAGKTAC